MKNPLLDDAMHMFNAGVGFMSDLKEQIMQDLKERMDEKIDDMQLVKRADVDRLEKQVSELRDEIAKLKKAK